MYVESIREKVALKPGALAVAEEAPDTKKEGAKGERVVRQSTPMCCGSQCLCLVRKNNRVSPVRRDLGRHPKVVHDNGLVLMTGNKLLKLNNL